MSGRLVELARTFLSAHRLDRDREDSPVDEELRAATIILLLEAALCDERFDSREREAIVSGISREFRITEADATTLLNQVCSEEHDVGRVCPLSRILRKRYSREQRRRIRGLLDRVLGADGELNEFELALGGYLEEQLG